ncbi:C2 calcium/lipid-binding domain-containing protein CaLB [Tanacetum coccineum]
MYLYAIRLKFKASNYAMDCEALLAGLVASANQGMKDLHVFIDSLTLVSQVEGNHTPATEHERRGDDEVKLTDEESFDDEDEIAEVFRIDTNIFDYETPICSAFNEFNYLLKDYEWYEALDDCELKDEALRNKAIMDGVIKNNESCWELKRKWNIYINYDDAYEINHEDNGNKELYEIHEPPVCNIRKYMMIKYSFNDDEEYVAVKEDEYDDLIMMRRDACQAYQEIFRIMDEGWMVTRAT